MVVPGFEDEVDHVVAAADPAHPRQATFRRVVVVELPARSSVPEAQEVEQFTDFVVELGWMTHGDAAGELVLVPSSHTFTGDVAGLDEISDDPLRRPLGDADGRSYVAHSNTRVALDAEEHLRVAGDEVPGFRLGTRHTEET